MARRSIPALHPLGILVGSVLTGIGVFVAETFLGPILTRSMTPPEERILGMVHERLLSSYVEPKDPEWLMHRAVEGMLDGLDDPYTYFVGPEDLQRLDEDSTGKLIGIGVILDGSTGIVRYPHPDGPAELAGIAPGDRFLSVDGLDVTQMTTDQIVQAIKGPRGTATRLGLERQNGTLYETEVVRQPVQRTTVGRVELLDRDAGIGHIHIRSFARTTPAELDQALDQLYSTELRGLVLDLRFNTGGLLDAAVNIASRFLKGGPVCSLQVRDGDDLVRVADAKLSRAADIPLVVLLNRRSASGSEVLAGALRDRGAAILVGEQSYGKGVYQQVHRYRTGNFALKFTAGYYLTPSGRILEGNTDHSRGGGLLPDLPVAVNLEQSGEIQGWLGYDFPPAKYREQVFNLFPRVAELKAPADPVLNTALKHLQKVIQA
ncbi:MAG: S41 family peptidase [Planctomycetota bacterium]|nr:S41 family peptidase [Planctomycetota bacterium]|tara:strand:- start:45879 stop:47177 length:1299 start_codon:yes stop_codon:yes gene_type:complete